MTNDNSWVEYGKQVLAELKRHDKWLGSIDTKLDNHITHLEHRMTKLEAGMKSQRNIFCIILASVLGIFGMVLVLLVA